MQFTSSALGAVIGCQKCGATTLKLVDSAVKNYIFGSGYICSGSANTQVFREDIKIKELW